MPQLPLINYLDHVGACPGKHVWAAAAVQEAVQPEPGRAGGVDAAGGHRQDGRDAGGRQPAGGENFRDVLSLIKFLTLYANTSAVQCKERQASDLIFGEILL